MAISTACSARMLLRVKKLQQQCSWSCHVLYIVNIAFQNAPKCPILKIPKIFWGRGTAPSPVPTAVGRGTPLPHTPHDLQLQPLTLDP